MWYYAISSLLCGIVQHSLRYDGESRESSISKAITSKGGSSRRLSISAPGSARHFSKCANRSSEGALARVLAGGSAEHVPQEFMGALHFVPRREPLAVPRQEIEQLAQVRPPAHLHAKVPERPPEAARRVTDAPGDAGGWSARWPRRPRTSPTPPLRSSRPPLRQRPGGRTRGGAAPARGPDGH